jgi:hypothetical protein
MSFSSIFSERSASSKYWHPRFCIELGNVARPYRSGHRTYDIEAVSVNMANIKVRRLPVLNVQKRSDCEIAVGGQ